MDIWESVISGLDFWEILIIGIAGFCSGVIKTGVGIGSGVFLLPTLALAFPAQIALGMGAPMMLASDVLGMKYYWKQWADTGTLKRLFGSALPGVLAGVILLPIIPGNIFRICIGIFGMVYALSLLWPAFPVAQFLKRCTKTLNENHAEKRIYIYGFGGGIATVLAHAGGLVWSLFLHSAIKDKRIFVGTIVIMFFVTNTIKTAAYMYVDFLSLTTLLNVIPAIPLIFLGSYTGNKLNLYMSGNTFRNVVLIFIFIVSLKMCI